MRRELFVCLGETQTCENQECGHRYRAVFNPHKSRGGSARPRPEGRREERRAGRRSGEVMQDRGDGEKIV